MSARRRPPRPRASSSASGCGRRRSSCGASRRAIRAPSIGERRAGRTAQLILPGLPPLPLPALAAKAHARNCVTGAMAHAFSRWAWAQARFQLGAASTGPPRSMRSPCAAATASSSGSTAPASPSRRPTTTASAPPSPRCCGTLVRVEIERATGALRIAKAYSVLECGAGARAGGRARAGAGRLRHGRRLRAARDAAALSRTGPATASGTSASTSIARGSDLPLHDLEIEMLPPLIARASRRRAWPRW